jgi:hypothetical protein
MNRPNWRAAPTAAITLNIPFVGKRFSSNGMRMCKAVRRFSWISNAMDLLRTSVDELRWAIPACNTFDWVCELVRVIRQALRNQVAEQVVEYLLVLR